jgi:hypothetical protein
MSDSPVVGYEARGTVGQEPRDRKASQDNLRSGIPRLSEHDAHLQLY